MRTLSFLFVFAAAFVVLASPCAAEPPAAKPRLGINLAGPADWATELPFVDVFRTARPWISQKKGAKWGGGPELAIDDLGWVKRLEPGCYAEAMLCTISRGHYPSGVYTVFYEGDGKIAFGKGPRVVESKPGCIRIEVDSSKGGFSLQVLETNPADYVRNIHVIMPGFESTWQKDPFHPAFLARWRGFACFRFMDWMHTNGSTISRWSDRPTLQHATFSKHGVALEWMIELCNRQKIDPWFCMPHLANDEYVRNFATLVRDRLDPGLTIYVEYSNEVWNGQFAQSRYAGEQGVKLGLGPKDKPWEAGWHYTAVRSMEIFAIWQEVLGSQKRLVRVLPSQSGNTGVSEGILGFRDAARNADVLAVAPYMPYTIGRGKRADLADEMKDWTVEQMLDHFEQTAFQDAVGRMRKDKAVADKYGLKLVAYEGGQHMVAMVKNQELVRQISRTMHAANRHPRMGELYRRYYDAWSETGGDLFAVFSSIGQYSNHGAWGLAEYYDSQPSEYPKLDATLRWAKEHGQPVAASGSR